MVAAALVPAARVAIGVVEVGVKGEPLAIIPFLFHASPMIEGGGGGGCPILAFGITERAYVDDAAPMMDVPAGDDEDDA